MLASLLLTLPHQAEGPRRIPFSPVWLSQSSKVMCYLAEGVKVCASCFFTEIFTHIYKDFQISDLFF